MLSPWSPFRAQPTPEALQQLAQCFVQAEPTEPLAIDERVHDLRLLKSAGQE